MIILGLTGSIGMGKSTVAAMLLQLGVPVHDADLEVHALLAPGGEASMAVAAAFPLYEFPILYHKKDKSIDRKALGALVFSDDEKRERLERILHPLVREAQDRFLRAARSKKRETVCLEIPLLFETAAESRVDYTMAVTAPSFVQKARVMSRSGMDADKFHAIVARQMPDAVKCALADYVIETGLGRADTMKRLRRVLNDIRSVRVNETPYDLRYRMLKGML